MQSPRSLPRTTTYGRLFLIPLLHVPPTSRDILPMRSHAPGLTHVDGLLRIQHLENGEQRSTPNMRPHARLVVNMVILLLGVICSVWLSGCFVISRISRTLIRCRLSRRVGSNGTRNSYPVTIDHHVLFWLIIVRKWNLLRIRWIRSWIGISSLLRQMRIPSMNDGYGKLVSRFPHHSLTMALPFVLTPFPYPHESVWLASMTHMHLRCLHGLH